MRAICILTVAAGMIAASLPSIGQAQEISGSVSAKTSYIVDDGFNFSAKPGKDFGPVVQGELELGLGTCSLNAWGSKTIGRKLGDELDLTASCSKALSSKTTVTLSVSDYIVAGDDLVVFEGKVYHSFPAGSADFTVTQYTWANQDATQTQIGFSPRFAEDYGLRLSLTHETGFDLADIITGGLSVEYPLGKHLTATADLVTPLKRKGGDPRKTGFALGLRYSF